MPRFAGRRRKFNNYHGSGRIYSIRSAAISQTKEHFSALKMMQHSLGNQTVQRMLQSQSSSIQTKLTVSKPGDRLEQEADRVAEEGGNLITTMAQAGSIPLDPLPSPRPRSTSVP